MKGSHPHSSALRIDPYVLLTYTGFGGQSGEIRNEFLVAPGNMYWRMCQLLCLFKVDSLGPFPVAETFAHMRSCARGTGIQRASSVFTGG